MLNKIIAFSLHNRITVLLASLLLIIWGLYIGRNTEVDVFPDLNAPTVVVMTEAKGMAAEEVEQLVTFPIETSVNGASHIRRVRSSSTNGFSVVWVEFDWNTDIYLARQIVSEKLSVVGETLPENVSKPTLGPQSSILGEMLIVGLTSDSTSMLDLRTLADWTIRPRLLSMGGVAQVAVLGGDVKEYQISLDPARMKHYKVTLDDVLKVTRLMNQNSNGGVINEYGNEYIVRGVISTHDVDEIARAVVKSSDGAPITLEDIADIKIGSQQPKMGTASVEGKPAVLITVTKQPNTGTIELTGKLDAAIKDLQKTMPKDVHVSTDIFRQSNFIDSSINNVKDSLYDGGIFVIIVLFLFLANVRTTLISLITLPISLIVSILVLYYMGLTINTMSLGGMAIAIGSLVDDAIVDVENVWKHLRQNRLLPKEEQKPVLKVVYDASREVRMPILNSTLIIVVSFIPLFFLTGMEGKMLAPLGIAFIVALFASTIVALTLTPVLCSYLLGSENDKKVHKEAFLSTFLKKHYATSLRWALNNKRIVIGGTSILFIVSFVMLFTLGRSFLPSFNEGSFTINVSSLPGISLEESDKIGQRAEKLLMTVPEIKTVARKTGRAELDEHALGVNVSEIEAPFELKDRSRKEVIADVRQKLSSITGANIEIGQPISHRIDAMLSGTKASIAIKLFGTDLNKMFSIANNIKDNIKDVEGIVDLNVEQQIERPQLKIVPKRELLARYGITLPEFTEFVNVNMAGEVVSQVYEDGKTFNLVVRSGDEYRDNMEKVKNLMIDTGNGEKIPLAYVADVISAMGPNTINRENVERKIVISANVGERDLRNVVNNIRERVEDNISLPEGYHIEYGGQFESEQAASRTLLITSIISIVVIFLLLYSQFRSAKQSGVILLNLPLALIGGVFALVITTGELSIPAIIGFISLFGIATRNGMLLISHYNSLRDSGLDLRRSIISGSLDRLNPILMTALSSALALIPLALRSDLAGNEIQSPMAKVILGGLLTSTFLNAFIIPIVYEMLNKNKKNKI
jgi:CzcA family heavy metal efflux pump